MTGPAQRRTPPALAAALALCVGCTASRATAPEPAHAAAPAPEAGMLTAPSGAAPAPPATGAVAGFEWPEPDRAQPPWSQTRVPPIALGAVDRGREAGGYSLRLGTERGVVRAWWPKAFRARGAALVLYVHGYYTDVDQAWIDHRLAEQFSRSGRNAVFLAVEAPSWNGEEPCWSTLDEIIASVETQARLKLPSGPIVVAGHSGAFRGILPWLGDPRIAEVLLLDGLYQDERRWSDWLDGAPRGKRRLVLVGQETAARAEAWLPTRPGAVFLPRIPEPARGLRRAEQAAPVLYMRARQDHMAIIERGQVLPLLLRLGRLERHGVGRP